MTPAELARVRRMERIGTILLIVAVVVGFAAEGYAIISRPLESGRVQPTAPARAAVDSIVAADRIVAVDRITDAESIVANATMAATSPIAAQGLTGRYRVSHRTQSVAGSEGCDDVALALARQAESVETVELDSAAGIIRLASRGVSGRITPDGRFETGPDSGVTDGVRWTFRMVGQFTRDGFRAEAQKTTDAIMRWHVNRSCAVVAELSGTRLPE